MEYGEETGEYTVRFECPRCSSEVVIEDAEDNSEFWECESCGLTAYY